MEFDRLWKFRFFLRTVSSRIKELVHPGQALSLDEMMVKSRARISWLIRMVRFAALKGLRA